MSEYDERDFNRDDDWGEELSNTQPSILRDDVYGNPRDWRSTQGNKRTSHVKPGGFHGGGHSDSYLQARSDAHRNRRMDRLNQELAESEKEEAEAEREIANEVLAGALQGDFNDDPTFWSDVGQIVTGLIPVAGQLGDIRDLVHILDDITNQEGYKKIGSWATLVLIAIGFIPGIGDGIKTIGKRGLKYLDNNRILKKMGEFLGENIIAPILNRVGDLTAPVVGQIKDAIRRKLAEAQDIARQLGEGVDNVIDDVTGQPRLVTEEASNVSPNKIDNTNQPRQNEPLQSTSTSGSSVPSGRVAQPGGQPDKYNSFTDNTQVPDKYKNDPRFNDLATDPDQGYQVKPGSRAEAVAGLEAEAQGLVPGPIKRGPEGTEFYDAQGRPWDVKAPPSPPSGVKWKFNSKKAGQSIKKELSQKAKPQNAPPGTYPNEATGQPELRRVIT